MNAENCDTASIEAAALSEVSSPELGITEQFFAVHSLDEESPVACTWKGRDQDYWLVHLRLKGEPYFFVVMVAAQSNELKVTGAYPSAQARVYLLLSSAELEPEEMTLALGIKPAEVRRKGDARRAGAQPFKENHWCLYPDCPEALEFETQLSFLLKKILPSISGLRSLNEKVSGVVQVAYYEATCSPSGWSLDRVLIKRLHELELDLDLDLYVSGPQYLD